MLSFSPSRPPPSRPLAPHPVAQVAFLDMLPDPLLRNPKLISGVVKKQAAEAVGLPVEKINEWLRAIDQLAAMHQCVVRCRCVCGRVAWSAMTRWGLSQRSCWLGRWGRGGARGESPVWRHSKSCARGLSSCVI
jgi:hypothetical protein